MRIHRTVVTVVVLSAVVGALAQAGSTAGPATASELTAYLAHVAPINAAVVKAEKVFTAADLAALNGKTVNLKKAQQVLISSLLNASAKLKRVTPPTVLKGPHAAFVSSLKLEAQGSETEASTLRIQWRQEVIAQLRRVGLAVPLWVKQVHNGG
jgi:hypothetical protein